MKQNNFQAKCECGKVCVEIANFPRQTPGRLRCYCDDCQSYLHHINRADLLDENSGTEVIPFYPSNLKIISGENLLDCVRLVPNGMFRFYTKCCQTPVANLHPKRAWAGFHRRMLMGKNPGPVERVLGPIRSSIFGMYAKGTPPAGTPQKFDFKGLVTVLPFILRGIIGSKQIPSPFFKQDNMDAIVVPHILSKDERIHALKKAGF